MRRPHKLAASHRQAGVSKSTVSLVLQGSASIRPETVDRVRKAIDDVGYVYNRGAANLRKAQSNVIGMVINDLSNPFYSELAVAIERVFQSAGIVPFIPVASLFICCCGSLGGFVNPI